MQSNRLACKVKQRQSVVARNNNRGDAEESADQKIKSLLQEVYQELKFEMWHASVYWR